MDKKAFTLAEIMITLTVIGVLAAVLLPSAKNLTPNEDVMKFKKAYNMLLTVMSELTNSDKYFLDGDLGVKSDGTLLDGTHEGDLEYLCNAIADNLSVKENNCHIISEKYTAQSSYSDACDGRLPICANGQTCASIYEKFDYSCLQGQSNIAKYNLILTSDGIEIYQNHPQSVFGIKKSNGKRLYNGKDSNSFFCYYNSICIDIDGVPKGATSENCINECPFGIGMRVDGKLVPGLRAQEWLEKSTQEK